MANDKKTELLGLNYSSASSSLRKQIIFQLAQALDLLSCYRCGTLVELYNFSIDHKEAWMQAEDPKGSFFDMNNIAFSHIVCNSKAGSHPNKLPEGEAVTRRRLRDRIRRQTPARKEYNKQYNKEYMRKYRASAQG